VRHVRILGLCLIAAFAVSAMVAGPALARPKAGSNNPKEWNKFENCPVNAPPAFETFIKSRGCIWGKSGGETYFQAGNITVHFTKGILLQGGQQSTEHRACTAEDELLYYECSPGYSVKGYFLPQAFVGPEYGNSTLSKAAQPAPSLTEAVDTALLSPKELERYEKYVAAGKTAVTATVELAGPASSFFLDETNLLSSYGEALGLPVQIKLTNPFLGNTCYVGSNENPIHISYTTGTTNPPPPNEPLKGKAGGVFSTNEGAIVHIVEGKLVDNSFASPGVTGCGVAGGADAAINAATGLPSAAGHNTTVLEGELEQAGQENVEEAREKGL